MPQLYSSGACSCFRVPPPHPSQLLPLWSIGLQLLWCLFCCDSNSVSGGATRRELVYELVGPKKAEVSAEWMYELEAGPKHEVSACLAHQVWWFLPVEGCC